MARPAKGKFSKRIFLGYTPDGKKIQQRIYADTKKDLAREEAKLRYIENTQHENVVFKNYARKWFEIYKGSTSASTQQAYENIIEYRLTMLHNLKLADITPTDCQYIINEYSDKPQLCRKIKSVLNQIYKQAIADRIVQFNPSTALSLPKAKEIERRTLTDEEKKALPFVELDDSDKAYMYMLLYFGLRPAEALALQKSDFTEDTVTINKAVELAVTPRIKETKTGSVRVLPIPEEAKEWIHSYLDSVDGLLFTMKDGELVSKTSLRRRWNRIHKAINNAMGGDNENNLCPDLHPYVFRYNYATNLYYSGITIKKAAYLMGHANTSMILKIYAQIDNEREKLDALKNMSFVK